MAKPIMIQGTMSNAGKSILTGGLCRIFRQDGYRTAPFKSQNMALNSFITEDGLEMGRAQVMQAEAAGTAPRVEMNPVLLKPTSDTGSQVIVNGTVRGVMPAKEYYAFKKQLIPEIMKAYQTLAAEYDIIVVEGAGSPAEINLKQDDIVNMGLARMLKAPVLLVGDIDRGGVFAQLAGTLMLLEEEERQMVRGLVINKFRGDLDILKPGLQMLEERTRCPVRGVIPYVHLDIDDEDSLSERFSSQMPKGRIDIAAVRFPRISNFTDLNVLSCYKGVSVRYVDRPAQFGGVGAQTGGAEDHVKGMDLGQIVRPQLEGGAQALQLPRQIPQPLPGGLVTDGHLQPRPQEHPDQRGVAHPRADDRDGPALHFL